MKREDREWWSKRENEKLERMRWREEERRQRDEEREKSEEREVDEEVWIFVSEKEREEDEKVGRKENDWVSGIQRWDEKREILFYFWFIFLSSKIMRVWHVSLFTFVVRNIWIVVVQK